MYHSLGRATTGRSRTDHGHALGCADVRRAYAIAIEKSYYKELGLDIDGVLTSKAAAPPMRNVIASSLPYGEVALSAALALKQGTDLKIIHTGVRTAGGNSLGHDAGFERVLGQGS